MVLHTLSEFFWAPGRERRVEIPSLTEQQAKANFGADSVLYAVLYVQTNLIIGFMRVCMRFLTTCLPLLRESRIILSAGHGHPCRQNLWSTWGRARNDAHKQNESPKEQQATIRTFDVCILRILADFGLDINDSVRPSCDFLPNGDSLHIDQPACFGGSFHSAFWPLFAEAHASALRADCGRWIWMQYIVFWAPAWFETLAAAFQPSVLFTNSTVYIYNIYALHMFT